MFRTVLFFSLRTPKGGLEHIQSMKIWVNNGSFPRSHRPETRSPVWTVSSNLGIPPTQGIPSSRASSAACAAGPAKLGQHGDRRSTGKKTPCPKGAGDAPPARYSQAGFPDGGAWMPANDNNNRRDKSSMSSPRAWKHFTVHIPESTGQQPENHAYHLFGVDKLFFQGRFLALQ